MDSAKNRTSRSLLRAVKCIALWDPKLQRGAGGGTDVVDKSDHMRPASRRC